jgi:hypothetical protein
VSEVVTYEEISAILAEADLGVTADGQPISSFLTSYINGTMQAVYNLCKGTMTHAELIKMSASQPEDGWDIWVEGHDQLVGMFAKLSLGNK